jgi:hypothetical protein
MSQLACSARTSFRPAVSTVLAGARLAGFLLPWVSGPALVAQRGRAFRGRQASVKAPQRGSSRWRAAA